MKLPFTTAALVAFFLPAWAAAAPLDAAAVEVRAGRPFVVSVVVPLCSNAQINCGGGLAGRPTDLQHNTYWGAIFGARRFFDRKGSGYERVEVTRSDELLERVVYRRLVAGQPWGVSSDVEQLVVLEAIDGAQIDAAVDRFWNLATLGGVVRFNDGGRPREETLHVVGYAGHDRLMDGKKLPPAPDAPTPIPSFVLACYSDAYFGDALRGVGSTPLVMTKALMAPEGYVIEAAVRALGANKDPAGVRAEVVSAYAKWQRIPLGTASWMFAR